MYKSPSPIRSNLPCLPPHIQNDLPRTKHVSSLHHPTRPGFLPGSVDNQQSPGSGGSNLPGFPLRQLETHSPIPPPQPSFSPIDPIVHPPNLPPGQENENIMQFANGEDKKQEGTEEYATIPAEKELGGGHVVWSADQSGRKEEVCINERSRILAVREPRRNSNGPNDPKVFAGDRRKGFPFHGLSDLMEQHFSGRALKHVQSALGSLNQNVFCSGRGTFTTTVFCPLDAARWLCVLINEITLVMQTKIDKYHIELVSILTKTENKLDFSAATNRPEQLMGVLNLYNLRASYNTCNILIREYNKDVKLAASALVHAPFEEIGAAVLLVPLVPDDEVKTAGLNCASVPALLDAPLEEHGGGGGGGRGGHLQPGFKRAAPIAVSQPTLKRWKPETCGKTVVFAIDALRNFKYQDELCEKPRVFLNSLDFILVPGAPRPISKRQTMFDARANEPFKKNGGPGGGAWVSVSASLKQQLEELKSEIDCASASTFKKNGAELKTASDGIDEGNMAFDPYAWIDDTGDVDVDTLALSSPATGEGEEEEEEEEEEKEEGMEEKEGTAEKQGREGKTTRFCSTHPPLTALRVLVMLNNNDGGGNENYIEPRSVVAEIPFVCAGHPSKVPLAPMRK
jgi:hypothetical protein